MQEHHKRRFGWLVSIVVVVALVMPIVFGAPRKPDGTGGDPWRNEIFDFQTLITGILAICAAWLTIRQMRNDDAAAQRRHEELTALSLRPDALCVSRAFEPQHQELTVMHDIFRKNLWKIGFPHEGFSMNREYLDAARPVLVKEFDGIHFAVHCCLEAMERPQFIEAARLFTGRMSRDIDVTKKHIERQVERYVSLNEPLAEAAARKSEDDRLFLIEHWLDRNEQDLMFFMLAMLVQLPKILKGLHLLEERYKPYLRG
ncbi:hypothetical protein HB780_06145 (plasmid) [Rhizobium lusitanum]|uniref:hypothetical protein n=1 Tax=Rhizobium lusitanum TaxID=293958 RepID=UPI001613A26A|nr:hypothetical protein [Rhizobium lusitanum]QND45327.1 hypothetical protein HB780_06145 [Rhizobium lusitanum]